MTASDKILSILKTIPTSPGVYQYFDEKGEIIYVGKAKNLKRRVSSYFNKEQTGKTSVLVKKIADIRFTVVKSESEALLLENNFIKQSNSSVLVYIWPPNERWNTGYSFHSVSSPSIAKPLNSSRCPKK